MSFLLNEEQTLLRDSARTFLSEQSPVSQQRALRDSAAPLCFDPNLWEKTLELGWTAAVMPESAGGLAVGYAGLGSIFEAAGRNLSPLPLLSHAVLAGELILRCADSSQQDRWLPWVLEGAPRIAVALDDAPSRAQAATTRAELQGDHWVLQGEKWFVMDGVEADQLLVTACADGHDAPEIFMVKAQAPGIEIQPLRMADSRNHALVRIHQVRVTSADRLAAGNNANALEAALDRARICLAAEASGIVREAFDRTISYMKERVQFDAPIGSFQALQHRVARLYTEIELLDSCVRGALAAIDSDDPGLPLLASLAKARANDLCERVLNEAVQLHGGIGVTDEFDMGLFLKRARVIQQTFGDSSFHRNRYAQLKGF